MSKAIAAIVIATRMMERDKLIKFDPPPIVIAGIVGVQESLSPINVSIPRILSDGHP
jgi:hypothetical protein